MRKPFENQVTKHGVTQGSIELTCVFSQTFKRNAS